MKVLKYMSMGLLALALGSCGSDYLDTEYTRHLDAERAGEAAGRNPDVFLNGMWSWQVEYTTNHDTFGLMSVLLAKEMMSEDIAIAAFHWFGYDYDFDNREYNYRRTKQDWELFYTDIAKANEIIGLYPEGGQTADEKGLLGQALAIRGMAYTYLPQIYQTYMNQDGSINREAPGVPILLTTAEGYTLDELDGLKGRNTVGAVLDQAEKDLTAAVQNLTESGYKRPTKNYVDLSVAQGLLARYYLLTQQWDKAASAANAARQGYTQRGNAELHDGFMSLSTNDVMWGFIHTPETETTYASYFSHISNLTPGYAGLGYSPKLIDARLYSQIADDDYRKSLFNDAEGDPTQDMPGAQLPYANLKFGNTGDWCMHYIFMRAAEMVLIEAEALVRQGKGAEAATVLGELMSNRQPSWSKSSVTLDDILLQRRIELWGEGFAYFDLKRNNLGIDRNYEGSNHLAGYLHTIPAFDKRWTYQIPQGEMQENSHIQDSEQNP
ncbi:MAG: RagB/SusD family nutrient uptake outer membrane protein [Prevotella sp.]|nr:RagB/SusD family nutrient uptake outer membrane protein [Prevotella sp.]